MQIRTPQLCNQCWLRLTTSNPDIQAIGSWARYLDLGTQAEARLRLTTSNPDIQAIGSWAKYLGLGTQAEAGD